VPAPAAAAPEPSSRPKRRRRRRFGRRGKQEGVTLQGLLLPPEAGRQALLCAETREACTTLLRGIAADLSNEANGGPDPVALLIDPSPEELADWRRDAPKAEIVAAGQPRHASDALAQASSRAAAGDDVILLVDSLTRLGEAYEDATAAKQFFDAGRVASGSGSLTVVAALERPAQG
jgi:transcription termination factor Rho